MMPSPAFVDHVVWGLLPDADRSPTAHAFIDATQRACFWRGVAASDGWDGATTTVSGPRVTVDWHREPDDQTPVTAQKDYAFDRDADAAAFSEGVAASVGWMALSRVPDASYRAWDGQWERLSADARDALRAAERDGRFDAQGLEGVAFVGQDGSWVGDDWTPGDPVQSPVPVTDVKAPAP